LERELILADLMVGLEHVHYFGVEEKEVVVVVVQLQL
jgi:hypothetical protein